MVICKYYLQNRCFFGSRCRYEHTFKFEDLNINQQEEFIRSSLIEWKNSGMWLLSKFVPFENYSEFGDFTSMLFEEDRYNFYCARENGTVAKYVANISEIKNKAMSRINNFINCPTNIYNKLRTIIRTDTGNTQIGKLDENKTSFAFLAQPQQQTQQHIFYNSIAIGNEFQQMISEKELATQMESESETGNNNISTTSIENESSIYSKLEDLNDWEIEEYKKDHFKFGKIPVKPPSFHLC